MKYIILPLLLIFASCKSDVDSKKSLAEQQYKNAIASALSIYSGVVDFDEVDWGGRLILTKQEYIKRQPQKMYYSTTDKTTDVDLHHHEGDLILSFDTIFDDNAVRLKTSRPQVEKFISNESTKPYATTYIVIYQIVKISERPRVVDVDTLSSGSIIVDGILIELKELP